jgi:excisionase family DNA binding protein
MNTSIRSIGTEVIDARRFISVPELARRWGVSLAHAYRLVERGELPVMRCGAALRIPITAVEAHERGNVTPA